MAFVSKVLTFYVAASLINRESKLSWKCSSVIHHLHHQPYTFSFCTNSLKHLEWPVLQPDQRHVPQLEQMRQRLKSAGASLLFWMFWGWPANDHQYWHITDNSSTTPLTCRILSASGNLYRHWISQQLNSPVCQTQLFMSKRGGLLWGFLIYWLKFSLELQVEELNVYIDLSVLAASGKVRNKTLVPFCLLSVLPYWVL